METSTSHPPSDGHRSGAHSRRFGFSLLAPNLFPAPFNTMLEYSGLFRRNQYSDLDSSSLASTAMGYGESTSHGHMEMSPRDTVINMGAPDGDLSQRSTLNSTTSAEASGRGLDDGASSLHQVTSSLLSLRNTPSDPQSSTSTVSGSADDDRNGPTERAAGLDNRENGSQRYDLQQAAQWMEQSLPFGLLLMMVFIREHIQGFLITFWLTGLLFKANDIVRKQAALKGERRILILAGVSTGLLSHVAIIYWWYKADILWRPLAFLPLKKIPGFWEALFIIIVNDTLVRFMAMSVKCALLVCYKNSTGKHYRRQAQLLTVIEYLLLLYRALIPAPVWYRFFLNEAYGRLFSALTSGLYLTFKLTSTFAKLLAFVSSIRAVARREVQFGTYATAEEVMAVGDMCAICQEKMHAPVSLRCRHVFCEDCVSEWFERERTCPLCRAVVKAAGLRSYGDGATTLLAQLF
eukprot:jgi/Mesen1/5583/ME000281S04638